MRYGTVLWFHVVFTGAVLRRCSQAMSPVLRFRSVEYDETCLSCGLDLAFASRTRSVELALDVDLMIKQI